MTRIFKLYEPAQSKLIYSSATRASSRISSAVSPSAKPSTQSPRIEGDPGYETPLPYRDVCNGNASRRKLHVSTNAPRGSQRRDNKRRENDYHRSVRREYFLCRRKRRHEGHLQQSRNRVPERFVLVL